MHKDRKRTVTCSTITCMTTQIALTFQGAKKTWLSTIRSSEAISRYVFLTSFWPPSYGLRMSQQRKTEEYTANTIRFQPSRAQKTVFFASFCTWSQKPWYLESFFGNSCATTEFVWFCACQKHRPSARDISKMFQDPCNWQGFMQNKLKNT